MDYTLERFTRQQRNFYCNILYLICSHVLYHIIFFFWISLIEFVSLLLKYTIIEKDYVSVKKEIDLILNLYSENIIGKGNNQRMKYLSDNFDKIHKENLIDIIDDRYR